MKFEDFVEINPKIKLDKGRNYDFIPMENLVPGSRYVSSKRSKLFKGGGAKFQNDDTLFARITPCLENGKISQAKNLKNNKGFGSTEFFVFRGKKGVSDDGYVYYLSLTEDIRKTAEKSMSGASGRQRADLDAIKEIEKDFPDLPTQQKIASILSAYDDLIENNTHRIKVLEEMAQTVYKEWFVNFSFPGHEKVKFVDGLPEGWEEKRLSELVTTQYGYTASATQEKVGPKFLRITDIVPSQIDWTNVPYCKIEKQKLEKYKLENGDIVIARTGATVGYAKRIHKNNPTSIFASYLVRLKSIDNLDNLMLGIAVESEEYKQFIKSVISGAAQPQANAHVLTSYKILKPTQNIITKFNNIVEPLFDLKESLQLKKNTLRKTRDMLLPKLMSGEIKV